MQRLEKLKLHLTMELSYRLEKNQISSFLVHWSTDKQQILTYDFVNRMKWLGHRVDWVPRISK